MIDMKQKPKQKYNRRSNAIQVLQEHGCISNAQLHIAMLIIKWQELSQINKELAEIKFIGDNYYCLALDKDNLAINAKNKLNEACKVVKELPNIKTTNPWEVFENIVLNNNHIKPRVSPEVRNRYKLSLCYGLDLISLKLNIHPCKVWEEEFVIGRDEAKHKVRFFIDKTRTGTWRARILAVDENYRLKLLKSTSTIDETCNLAVKRGIFEAIRDRRKAKRELARTKEV